MSKAVIVLDMPKGCYACRFHLVDNLYSVEEKDVCEAYCGVIPENDMKNKPKWCPLKPLPKKKEVCSLENATDVEDWFDNGYNSCLDEILGDEE